MHPYDRPTLPPLRSLDIGCYLPPPTSQWQNPASAWRQSLDFPSLQDVKPKKKTATRACLSCKLHHTSCDNARPCRRCVTRGREDDCVDVQSRRGAKSRPGQGGVLDIHLPRSGGDPAVQAYRAALAKFQAEQQRQACSEFPSLTNAVPPPSSSDATSIRSPSTSASPSPSIISPPYSAAGETTAPTSVSESSSPSNSWREPAPKARKDFPFGVSRTLPPMGTQDEEEGTFWSYC